MEGRFDSIIVDPEKNISDTSICNVFAIIDDVVHTPGLDSGALNGVLRKNLILLLKSNGYKVVERKISDSELLNADEIFLTNVIRGIVPVNQLQEKIFIKQSVTNKIKVLFGEKNESFKQLGV
jgi:branched-subunit amino acid aminotransferase/4-amino-4-deoxychorismate lyase